MSYEPFGRLCASTGHFPSPVVALLCLTGAEARRAAALQWTWIEGDHIEFPAEITKNGQAWTVPLSNSAQTVLSNVPRFQSSNYVFPASRQRSERTTTINGWSKAKAAFDRECGVSEWTLHDLRRTFATNLQRLGVRLEVTEALLNHVSGTRAGIVGVYQQHRYEAEKREAIQRFEAYLTSL